jgi:hypothetical protein|tara:strand:- start:2297 stop:3226 length:930 start_codon:yes stop_codon:yes gene_type:complete
MTEDVKVEEVVEAKDDFEVEIVDDTPEQDKGKVPLKVDDNAEAPVEEMEQYSAEVQKRINKLTKKTHDERRAKEAKEREAREAYNYAKALQEENRRLKENLSKGENVLMEESKARANAELTAAQQAYKKAYEDADSDAMVDAQTKLAHATVAKNDADRYDPKFQEQEKPLQTDSNSYNNNKQVPEPDPKAKEWFAKNTWFGNDEEMTALAYGLHEKLIKQGIDPRSDEYYEKIDSRLKQIFPDRLSVVAHEEDILKEEVKKSAPANVVAPVKRSPSSKKITLTSTQVSLAKRLGVPLEEYAKQVSQLSK